MRARNLSSAAGVAASIAATMLRRYRAPMNFRNQTAFINGGSRGLGLLARELASRGAKVAISARDIEELRKAVVECAANENNQIA